ncbi:MAG: hypothetical protein FD168_1989 [Desulfobulbaceae bacterium]|nr:MAG: hypothetical protein FD168_1989 [Desulfobulbaceae bacterium]
MNERKTRSTLYLQLNLKRDAMKTATSTTKTDIKTGYLASDKTQAVTELQKNSTVVIGFASLLCGAWAVACMTAGLIACGGPAGLILQYFSALS